MPISPLRLADTYARGLQRHPDGNALTPEQARALPPLIDELRRRLRAVPRMPPQLIGMLIGAAATAAGSLLSEFVVREWRLPLIAAVAAICSWPILRVARRPTLRGSGPPATGTPAELADELMGTLQGAALLAGRSRRPFIAHAEARAAAVWSIVHGGPVFAGEAPPNPAWRPRWARREVNQVYDVAARLHELGHMAAEEAAAADEPDAALHRLARYTAAQDRLVAAATTLSGRALRWQRVALVAAQVGYVVLVAVLLPNMTVLALAIAVMVLLGPQLARPECRTIGVSNVDWSLLSAGVVAGIDQSSADLADLAQTPAVVAALAELTAAREILAGGYNSST
ncbi:hypothetical protein [Phytomonospora endophytica]|uniref:Uncharacterized protein n=1 Tax=Phytomonospora endophytica TaxID=714109 RepID=A0A841FVM6_9ACTN|nr:hypothetical protein [Phytomonospora endophytica]MBB6039834.1 hypothetical protein [Phytomonospora endophytica]GIG70312.1 hypothetical protein Pen01_66070 [Phytomonospora endophytica]